MLKMSDGGLPDVLEKLFFRMTVTFLQTAQPFARTFMLMQFQEGFILVLECHTFISLMFSLMF